MQGLISKRTQLVALTSLMRPLLGTVSITEVRTGPAVWALLLDPQAPASTSTANTRAARAGNRTAVGSHRIRGASSESGRAAIYHQQMAATTDQAVADPLRQAEARRYGRSRRRLWLCDSIAGLAALVAAVAVTHAAGVAGVIVLVLAPALIGLPFGLAGHRLARRFGQSRQTTGSWFADQLRGWGVAAALGVPAAAALLGLQRLWPGGWPVAVWLLLWALQALLVLIFPVLLLPLFLRSERLADGPLRDALVATCAAAGVTAGELRMLRMGEKTAAANAMVAGIGPTARIYIGDTLTETADESDQDVIDRICGVLAHELGHRVHRDQLRQLVAAAGSSAVGAAGLTVAIALVAPGGAAGHLACLPAAVLGLIAGTTVTTPAMAWYSRRRERAADRYAIGLTGRGKPVARAFERLAAQNLAELDPPRLLHLLTGGHPTLRERIETARAVAT